MKVLEREINYGSFLDRLKSAPARVLLLDYDGTLAPFCVDRSLAFPYPQVPALLVRIRGGGTQVVLITGRPARELILLSGIDPHPEIWGSHGLERVKTDGSYEVAALPHEQEKALSQAARSLRTAGLGRRIEVKPGGVALHWRGLSRTEAEESRHTAHQLWLRLLTDYGLTLLEFDGGMEIRVPGRAKGDAVQTILAESKRDAAVAYLGDDQTDEDAFHALKGKGLTALVRPQSRPSAADVWLQPPQELLRFFEEWLRASGGER